ncbi:MAG: YqgE/AlgH family protein [Deltaproteobacteria bacterium]|nr:YqgE/AlgH family protein [Deltaproteobacteria bacterium]MBN2670630.1 YqgE/AlgH family protein [Deltaproteobacteria bacterium]
METQLAPGFLVASPQLKDPFFEKTVIFLLEHDHNEGTFGIIMNKLANIQLNEVFSELNISLSEEIKHTKLPQIVEGGPVTPELGWVIHSSDWSSEKTKLFCESVGVTASLEILQDIAIGQGPARFWFCLGYSGWGPKQLMKEIQIGSWLHLPFSADLFFDIPHEQIWKAAIGKLGIDPAYFSPLMGGA